MSDIGFLWFQCRRSTAKINEAGFGFFSTVTKLSLMRRGKIRSVEKSPMLGNIFRLSLMDDSSWVYVFSHLKNQPVCGVGKSYVGTPPGDFIFLQEFANFTSFRLKILQYWLLLFLTCQWEAVHVELTVKVTTTMNAWVMAWWWTCWCQRCWQWWWTWWSGSCIPELQNREVLGNAARRNFSL